MAIRVIELLAFLFCCSLSHAEEAVEIPLDQIWALNIPGTKDVRLLEGAVDKFDAMTSEEQRQNSLVGNTSWLLSSDFRPVNKGNAGPGFVVRGGGLEALKEANAVLAQKAARIEMFRAGEKLTLVFFSYSSPRRLRFENVTRNAKEVVVNYRLLNSSHKSLARSVSLSTRSFALIPIESFTSGPVSVRIRLIQEESRTKEDLANDLETASRIVCDSFTFGVTEQENEKGK